MSARRPSPAVYQPEDFPGCESLNLPASEADRYQGRPEFRDAHTEWELARQVRGQIHLRMKLTQP